MYWHICAVPINNPMNRRLLIPALVAIAVTLPAVAQKAAFFASETILARFPEAVTAREKLAEFQGSWMREVQRQEQERDKLVEEMQTNRLLWSQQERKDAESRLRDIESKLAVYRSSKFGPNGEFEQRQKELMGPVFDKVQKAVEEVAQTQKYDLVFDKSSRGLPLVYASSTYDITGYILKRLGVEVDATEMPKENADGTKPEDAARKNRGRRDTDTSGRPDPNDLLNGQNEQNPPKQ
jgi:Skp family chaperone for outer membrane proteins